MRLPNGERAIVEIEKLRDYCLSMSHPRGRLKARVFSSVLGLEREHADAFRETLLRMAAESLGVEEGESDQFGRRYFIEFQHRGPIGVARVRSAWIVRSGEDIPRFVTCCVFSRG